MARASTRTRWTLATLAALALHLVVLALLGTQLHMGSVAQAAPDLHPHSPLADDGAYTPDALFDLTPPEVRSLGGGSSMAEHLDTAPAVLVPSLLQRTAQLEQVDTTVSDGLTLVGSRFGRAPPAG